MAAKVRQIMLQSSDTCGVHSMDMLGVRPTGWGWLGGWVIWEFWVGGWVSEHPHPLPIPSGWGVFRPLASWMLQKMLKPRPMLLVCCALFQWARGWLSNTPPPPWGWVPQKARGMCCVFCTLIPTMAKASS